MHERKEESVMARANIIIGVVAGSTPGGPRGKRTLHKYFREGSEVDYWDDEDE